MTMIYIAIIYCVSLRPIICGLSQRPCIYNIALATIVDILSKRIIVDSVSLRAPLKFMG